jgi:hypothetical protein
LTDEIEKLLEQQQSEVRSGDCVCECVSVCV